MKLIIFILLFSVYILVGCNTGEITEEDTPLVVRFKEEEEVHV